MIYILNILERITRLTDCVMPRMLSAGYWWVGRDNASLPEPTSSHEHCLTARRACARRAVAVPPPHLHSICLANRAVPVWPRRSLSGIGCILIPVLFRDAVLGAVLILTFCVMNTRLLLEFNQRDMKRLNCI